MFMNYNYKILEKNKEFVILVPLDRQCAKFLTSFNCGSEGASWCIGSEETWNRYIGDGTIFYFMYFFERHPIFGKKLIIEINKDDMAYFYTQKNKRSHFGLLAEFLAGKFAEGKK